MAQIKKKTQTQTKKNTVTTSRNSNNKNIFSSKKVLIIFALSFTVVGLALLKFSHAQVDPVIDAQQSNEKAFNDLKSHYSKHGIKVEKIKLPPKPKDFGKSKSNSDQAMTNGRHATSGIPPLPSDPVDPQLPKSSSSLLFPKVSADGWTRAAAISVAGGLMNWNSSYFVYYGLWSDPNEAWCSDFVSYVMMRASYPFYWGTNGWRVQNSNRVIAGLYATGTLRSRGYTPKTGDLVFFDWGDPAVWSDHVGIVESVDKGGIHTIEGNIDSPYNNASHVGRRTWAANNSSIIAFGQWLGN